MYGSRPSDKGNPGEEDDVDPRLKNIEPKMIELINNEVRINWVGGWVGRGGDKVNRGGGGG